MNEFEKAANEVEVQTGNLDDSGECCIEWIRHSETATVGLTKTDRMYSVVQKLAEKCPDDVKIKYSSDGYMVAHLPRTWVTIRAPKQLSEETKERLRENIRKAREKK